MLRWLGEALGSPFVEPKTKEEAAAQFDEIFERTKRTSDFVGMVVRFGFATFATSYFIRAWFETDIRDIPVGFFKSWVLFLSGFFALALTVLFGLQILVLIFSYYLIDAATRSTLIGRSLVVLIALAVVTTFGFGIMELVFALPRPGANG